jgi:hypothetical protein
MNSAPLLADEHGMPGVHGPGILWRALKTDQVTVRLPKGWSQ